MPRTPWILSDFSTGIEETFEFPINPNQFTPPGKTANITTQRTTAPNGQAIIFQGLNEVVEGSFSGVVKTQDFYTTLSAWAAKWYPLILQDDRANTWQILIRDLQWTRRHRYIDPDTYEYTVKFLELPV